ncbi:unnamed protein product [Caenorhabditis bovis]|uniref:LITAF domain-containing protein n=1 Tax=Caenorhabditis bovis TaxID=2654633 RepID=A0A8S1ESS6_9PELO|nr:unnamed protein product [Caenorhabditis bovis]
MGHASASRVSRRSLAANLKTYQSGGVGEHEPSSNTPKTSSFSRLLSCRMLNFAIRCWALAIALADAFDYKLSVLIFPEEKLTFEQLVGSVTHAFVEVFGGEKCTFGNDTIEAVFVDATGDANRLAITDDVVCGQMLNSSLASVIYSASLTTSAEFLSLVSSASYALSFYKIPVVGVMVRDAEFSKKKIYPTFVRPTAPLSDEAFVQRYIQVELNEHLNDTLAENFEEVTSNIIVLFAKKDDAMKIFQNTGDLSGKVWLVSESAGEAPNVPNGSLGCRLSQSTYSVLRDSLVILKIALEHAFNVDEQLVPPVECDRESAQPEWSGQAKMLLSAICDVSTTRIHFNEKCERIGVEYDILNFNAIRRRQVGSMIGDVLQLDEEAIEWAGGAKPLEISLPKHLRVVTVADPPFVYITPVERTELCAEMWNTDVEISKYDTISVPGPWYPCPMTFDNFTDSYCCAGLAIDLLSNLALPEANNSIDTSFTFSLHLNESYGVVQAGEMEGLVISGMIGELDGDTADMAIGGLTINPERERIIDFTEPWLYHGIRILEKNIPRDSPMQSFLQPLQSSLWTALFVSVLLVGLAIYCLDFKSPFERFYQADREKEVDLQMFNAWDDDKNDDDNVNFGEAMWFVWGVLLNSGVSEKTPRSCSARALGIVWCGFCMIMVASYTANLAAFLVLDQPEKGLTGVTDPRLRNPSANFSFGTVLNSNVYQYFKRHVELSTMFRKMEAHNVWKASEAVHLLLNGTLDAFIWDSTRLEFEAARHCELRTRGSLFGRSAYGIGLQKHSPWTPHITSAILRMSESGVMEHLDQKWIDSNKEKCIVEVHKSPARLGLVNMKDIFILVTTGVVVGAILSAIEVWYGRRLAERGRRRIIVNRYAQKWLGIARGIRKRGAKKYHLSRPVIRRGFSGMERCTFEQLKELRHHRGLSSSRFGEHFLLPDYAFNDKPVVLFCPRCRNIVETDVHRETGVFAILSCFLFAVMFLWPCSPLPCFLNAFSDFLHVCPNCAHKIGRFRRARSPKFYV